MKLFTVTVHYISVIKNSKKPIIKALAVLAEDNDCAVEKIRTAMHTQSNNLLQFTDFELVNCSEMAAPDFTKGYAPGFII